MSTTSSSVPVTVTDANEDKTIAIVSYLTLIGFIVAIVMHSSKKTALGTYHLRQSLGLLVTSIAVILVGLIPVIGWLMVPFLWIGLAVLWFTGFLAAVNGQRKPVVLLGQHYEKWFGSAFA